MRALGAALARVITARAVETCLGASAITAVPAAAAVRAMPAPCPPAAAPIWLWCAGRDVPVAALRRALGDALDAAVAAALVALDGDRAIAGATIAPVGAGLVIGDRHDDPDADRVPWPDDSTLHLAGCLPARPPARWLDVGTGAAAAPLAAPWRAAHTRATDVAARALARARTGLALAGRADVEVAAADLLDGAGPGWDLVTFNAPIPAEHGGATPATGWHRAAPGAAILPRFWQAVAGVVAPGGEVIVHGALAAPLAVPGGELVIARYTPPGLPAFAIARWRPGAPARTVEGDVALAPGRPFVRRADLDAIAG